MRSHHSWLTYISSLILYRRREQKKNNSESIKWDVKKEKNRENVCIK